MSFASRLTLKQLRTFVAVYQRGKLALAAEDLGITQSAVSLSIRQIEETLNIRLFDRTTRSLAPTQAAHDAIGIAQRILQDVETLGDNIRDLSHGVRGRVHFAATPATGMTLLPETVQQFSEKHSNIKLVIDDCAPTQFLSHIQTEKVEFGIGVEPDQEGEFDSAPILEDNLQLICLRSHPLARGETVRWSDLKRYPLITFRGDGYGMQKLVQATILKAGVEPNIAHEVGFLQSAIWMVGSGLGVAILPTALARQHNHKDLVVRPLVDPVVSRTMAVVTKKGRSLSPACALFVEMLIETVRAEPGEVV